jgi:hypothetical protein
MGCIQIKKRREGRVEHLDVVNDMKNIHFVLIFLTNCAVCKLYTYNMLKWLTKMFFVLNIPFIINQFLKVCKWNTIEGERGRLCKSLERGKDR